MVAKMKMVATLLLGLSAIMMAEAASRDLLAAATLGKCQVCVTVSVRNTTTQGKFTKDGCTAFVNSQVNTAYAVKISTTDAITFTCGAPKDGGRSITACSPISEVGAIAPLLASIADKAGNVTDFLLKSSCPANKANQGDFVQVDASTNNCPVNIIETLSQKFCYTQLGGEALGASARVVIPAAGAGGSGPQVQNSPVGQGYCKLCFTYQTPYGIGDVNAMFAKMSKAFTFDADLSYMWTVSPPLDQQIAFWRDSFDAKSMTICTSSTYYANSPLSGAGYRFTSDYIAQMTLINAQFFTSQFNLGCQSYPYGSVPTMSWSVGAWAFPQGTYPLSNAQQPSLLQYCAAASDSQYKDGGYYRFGGLQC